MMLLREIILFSPQISGDVYWMWQQRRRCFIYLLCAAVVSLHVDVGLLLLLLLLFGVVNSVVIEGPAEAHGGVQV